MILPYASPNSVYDHDTFTKEVQEFVLGLEDTDERLKEWNERMLRKMVKMENGDIEQGGQLLYFKSRLCRTLQYL